MQSVRAFLAFGTSDSRGAKFSQMSRGTELITRIINSIKSTIKDFDIDLAHVSYTKIHLVDTYRTNTQSLLVRVSRINMPTKQ